MKPVRILIVDDSASIRRLLSTVLGSDPGIEVIGAAPDPYIARDKIKALNPDVITLDVEMPRMDGLTFLDKLMRGHPMPVVMISSLTQDGCDATLRALELGAVDFFPKPTIDALMGIEGASKEICEKVKAAARAKVKALPRKLSDAKPVIKGVGQVDLTHKIIAIGASTGGTEAVKAILTQMPRNAPGIVVVQHMPPGFTASFANRLNGMCEISVSEARDGDRVLPGHALIAPGDLHTEIDISGAMAKVRVYAGDKVGLHRPSVDVLFTSCATKLGKNAIGVILTGMGADGARGMREMYDAGAYTVAQDEASCVVFGMPMEAIARGGVSKVLPLGKIAGEILQASRGSQKVA